jgi:hypothetical protein
VITDSPEVWVGWEERRNAEAQRALGRQKERRDYREKKKAGLVNARQRNSNAA